MQLSARASQRYPRGQHNSPGARRSGGKQSSWNSAGVSSCAAAGAWVKNIVEATAKPISAARRKAFPAIARPVCLIGI
jgi:hypothetical protein